jgi:E3 ubiquitin-protein ligase synoviolin
MLLTFATLLKWAFLNSLRDIEFENMQDRLWVTIMDTLLAMTIFHDEFGYLFFFLFGGLLACKVFHWLASDRVDYVASGTVHGLFAHVRLSALMFSLLLWDVAAFYYCGSKVWRQPPSVMILFAFEYCLLTISMIGMLVKYALNCYDLTLDGQWESKGVIILYMDFFVDIIQLLVYVIFFVSLFRHYGIPLHLVRQIWLTFQSFWKRVTLVMR